MTDVLAHEETEGSATCQRDDKGRFITGNNGGGRKKGACNKLGEAFIDDLHADWAQHGAEVLKQVRTEKPDVYLRVAASLIPKQLHVEANISDRLADIESLTDAEIDTLVEQLEGTSGKKVRDSVG